MGLGSRAVVVAIVATGIVATVACGSYGEEGTPGPAGADASPTPPATTTDSGGGSTLDVGPDTELPEAGPSERCPPCSGSCLASGCSGSPQNSCQAAYDATRGDRFSVFICPEGQTVELPVQCNNGGIIHVAAVRLGAGSWQLKTSGTMPVIASGDCAGITACKGSTSSTTTTLQGPTVAMIGSLSAVSSCRELLVEID